MWQHAAEPSVRLPISTLVMSWSPCFLSSCEASTIWRPAPAVSVAPAGSDVSIESRFMRDMSMTVPWEAAQGVRLWLLPMARTGLG